MRYVLFENPYILITILAIVEYILLVAWMRRRTPGAKRAALIGLLLCVAVPIMQQLVVTHQEQLRTACETMVEAAEQGDVATIAQRVAAGFAVRDIDRERFLRGVENALTRWHIEDASMGNVQIEVTGNRAAVTFNVTCRVIATEEVVTGVVSAWTTTFELIDGQWMLIAVEPKETPLFPVRRLEDMIR
jgi:hypothetical protein